MSGSEDSLEVLLVGMGEVIDSIEGRLKSYPRVGDVHRIDEAEFAKVGMRRLLGAGTPVNAVFIDPIGPGEDWSDEPKEASRFVRSIRKGHPDVVVVLLATEGDLERHAGRFEPEMADRLLDYYRIDTGLRGTDLDHAVDRMVDKCLRYFASRGAISLPVPYEYDFALSFAGEDRAYAEELARALKERNASVFLDDDRSPDLVGEDLRATLHEVYAEQSHFVIIIESAAYREKKWPKHELAAAITRAARMRGGAYILPIRLEEVEIPGLPDFTGHLPGGQLPGAKGVPEIADRLMRKLSRVT